MKLRPDAITIFLLPPNLEELENRLTGRCTNDTDDIRNRMEIAKREIEIAPLYKYNVVNDDLQRCVDEIDKILNKELLTQNSKEI